jgi:RNA polymerase sigma factor (sigma-70 family)
MNRVSIPPAGPPGPPDTSWLRTLLPTGVWDARPDVELLDRFARYAEQPAFEAILRRHGPLVWGVCRRALTNPADAEDAFQATFLVLVRKAGSVARGERLGPWLYGVAYRVARRVREKAARTPACEPEAAAMIPDRPQPTAPDTDWLPALDRELQALPARYREPLILCELQGLSRRAAAEKLRIREGTLSSRLARGRTLLRARLLKHGTLLPAGGLAALLGPTGTAPGGVFAGVVGRTAALIAGPGEAPAGVVPARVANLTDEVMKGMFLNKLRVGGAAVLTLAVAVGLVAAAGPEVRSEPPAGAAKTPAAPGGAPAAGGPAARPSGGPAAPVVVGDLAALQGHWDGERVLEGGSTPKEPVTWVQCIVRGGVAWLLSADDDYASRWEVRLTPDRDPKWVDLVSDGCSAVVREKVPGAVTPGIYRITPDGWELTLPVRSTTLRPAEFATEGSITCVRFRRAKEAPAARQPAASRELIGRWAITRQAYPHDDRSAMVDRPFGAVEITPEYLFVQRPCDGTGKNFVWEVARYTLDPTKTPKWIDLTFVRRGGTADRSGYGVYEVNGDALRISYRLSVPRLLRTLEFKAGVEEVRTTPGDAAVPDDQKPACGLLELRRAGTPPGG